MKFDSRDVALTAVVAALYVTINLLQTVLVGSPTIFGPIQLRVADCLIALAALLGWPVVGGVTLGCFLTNTFNFLGIPDVIFGPIANMIAATLVFMLRKRRFIACFVGALPVGIIVGGYLWMFFPPPDVLSSLPVWLAMITSITISSLIAITGIGYILLVTLSQSSIVASLKARGLKTSRDGEEKETKIQLVL